MGERPKGLTLHRINNEGGYEPGNCKWATGIEQMNNMVRNRFLTYNGKTMTMAMWAREVDLDVNVVERRLNELGWSVEKSLTAPNRTLFPSAFWTKEEREKVGLRLTKARADAMLKKNRHDQEHESSVRMERL
jgi:hypothetical protein